MNVLLRRGRRERSLYDGESLSITELLRKPGVSEYLQRNRPLTYESQRNKLRRELRVGEFFEGGCRRVPTAATTSTTAGSGKKTETATRTGF